MEEVKDCSYLIEPNIGRPLPETLTADIQSVLADKPSPVGADTTI